MTTIKVLVLTGYGLNCDYETAYAFELAGAESVRAHINDLISGKYKLSDFHIMTFIGGFSWGDDHGAGVVQAVRMKTHLGEQITDFINAGKLVIGICNGFQTLVNLGLLPGFDNDYTTRSTALIHNDCGNFRDQWVKLTVNPDSPCIFTKGLTTVDMPVRHGEGKFYTDAAILSRLAANHQIVMRYALPDGSPAEGHFPDNPNGSLMDAAGICDPTGRVFGLMPHPEAAHHFTLHPDWTRRKQTRGDQDKNDPRELTRALSIFKNAVDYFS